MNVGSTPDPRSEVSPNFPPDRRDHQASEQNPDVLSTCLTALHGQISLRAVTEASEAPLVFWLQIGTEKPLTHPD